MKRLLILLILLMASTSWAQDTQVARLSPAIVGGGVAADPCAGYTVCQGFEGTGYDNSETWSETVDYVVNEDYTSTVLVGSQSLRLAGDDANRNSTYTTFSIGNDIYGFFHVQVVTGQATALNPFVSFDDQAVPTTGYFRIINGPFLAWTHGSATGTGSALTAGTHYCIWFRYKIDSGPDDGIFDVYTKAYSSGCDWDTATHEVNSITAGTDTTAVVAIQFRVEDAAWDILIDNVKVSATQADIWKDQD